jgi:putative transposase
MQVNTETIDEMLTGHKKPDDVLVENGLLKQLTTALLQYALNGQGAPISPTKTYPRFTGFDDKIEELFGRGYDLRGIRKRIDDYYRIDVTPEIIAEATGEISEKLKAWQNRRLEPVYPIITLYTHYVEILSKERAEQRAVHVPVGISLDGRRELLGLWTSANQDTAFWASALTGLRKRGVADVFLVSSDKLEGLLAALPGVFPQAEAHLSVTHMVQTSLQYVNSLDTKQMGIDLKTLYSAASADDAAGAFAAFTAKWGGSHGALVKLWKDNWPRVISFCGIPDEVQRVMSAVNALDSLHATMRQSVRKRGAFPNEEEALKLLYVASRQGPKKWGIAQYWKEARNRFELSWEERIQAALAPNTGQSATAPRTVQSDLPGLASVSGGLTDFPPPPVH